MLRRIFTLKFLLWTGFVLAVLVLTFITEENWRGRRAWETYRAAAEKRGVKLFLEDFIQPDIPDAENYAAIPLIRDLFAKPKDGETPPSPFKLPVGKVPDPSNDLKSRRFDVTGWQQFLLKTELLAEKSDSAARDILHALEKYEPALQQLRDASSRPKCKFPTHWENGVATQLPHLTFCLAATKLFCIRAQAHLALGESLSALAELRNALRLHRAFGSELSVIAGLVRMSSLATIEYSVWDGLAGRQWTDEDLAALEKHFSELRIGEDWRFAFASERGFVNACLLKQVGQSPAELDRDTDGFCSDCNDRPLNKWIVFRTFPRGWMYLLMIRNNDYFDWLIARCAGPESETPIEIFPTYATSSDWSKTTLGHPGVIELEYIFMLMSQQVFDTAYKRYLFTHTRTQETRLACILERFRRAKGGFPEKLHELVPTFIDAIPKDAFDGKPFRYRRNADGGYDLWSIGSDRKDDGGHIDPNQKIPESQDDWIWHMPGQPKTP